MRKLFVLLVLLVVATGAFAQDPYLDPQLDPVFTYSPTEVLRRKDFADRKSVV